MRPDDAAARFRPPELLQGGERAVAEEVVLEAVLGLPVLLRRGRIGRDAEDAVAGLLERREAVVEADGLDGASAFEKSFLLLMLLLKKKSEQHRAIFSNH